MSRRIAALSLVALTACPGPNAPGGAQIAPLTLEVGQPGALLSGVAASGDGATVFVAMTRSVQPPDAAAPLPAATVAPAPSSAAAPATAAPAPPPAAATPPSAAAPRASGARTTISARRRGEPRPRWHTDLDGTGGPLARAGGLIVAALGGTGSAASLPLRGEPGAAVAALDAATGAIAWKLALDATDWSVIAALAATPDGVVVGGSFSGTLRVGDKIVSSGGRTDGFVARLTAQGGVAWVIRVGGPGADAVQGIATAGARIAIAGTFTAGADLLGAPLPPFDDRSIAADGFVAELDAAGARRWVDTFGGKHDETVAGVAIDARGRIAVAATIRETVHVGGAELAANGPADGMVAWWTPSGTADAQLRIGGTDFDGLRAITATGDRVVVAGFFSGAIQLGDRALTAAGGDDAFLAELDAGGRVVAAWPVTGDGREEITALADLPGGFVAGIAHTAAATAAGDPLPAPADPMSGAAVVVRPAR